MALLLGIGVATATAGMVPEALYDKAAREGSVRVIVQLRVTTFSEGQLESAAAVAFQRQDIAAMRGAALAELAGTGYRTIREFETIPFVALEVAPDAMAALEASPNVVGVEEDRLESVALSQSVPLIGADQAWAAGFDGTGIVVAILDTGVDNTHPFLSGKVVEEACYSSNGNCPNGLDSQTGPGAGIPCTYAANGCQHGTHVAGIAAGSGAGASVGFSGVARGASIMAVQVFSKFTGGDCAGKGEDPCTLTFLSDQIAALDRVFLLRNQHSFAAVNLSLGGGQFSSPCDSSDAARKAAIDTLRSVGIATVAASGNDGFTGSLNAPACISTAVSVGSTTNFDVVSSFSNSASFLSLLAPGSSIKSSVPGGGFAFFSGTSMATPHVTGAWAILKQAKPSATVNEVRTALTGTGVPITDPKNGLTKPRIRVDQALQAVTTSHSLTITGGPSASPNPVASGATANLSVSATDSLGHSLSYAWTASCQTLGSNGSFNNATLQTPAWTAPVNAIGSQRSCTMQVTVSDGQGLSQIGSYVQGVATMPVPDLVPSINPVSSTGTPGGTILLSASVVNQGAVSAGAFRLGFYFSTNTTITTFDTFFAFCTFSGLAVGQSVSCSVTVTIPASLSPGVYFIGVIADDQNGIPESNGANNTALTGPITLTALPPSAALLAAVLPTERTGLVGGTVVTAFATLLNTGAATALGCAIAPLTSVPSTFLYQATNAQNALTGTANTPVDIPPGQGQSYLFAFTPTAPFSVTEIQLSFACTNTAQAPITPGVNTFRLRATATPAPDPVALVAVGPPNDGILRLASAGAFAVATVNLGAAGLMTVTADTGGVALPVSLFVCETNPGSGACLAPPTPSVQTQINAGATPTFGVFVDATDPIAFDPATHRIQFHLEGGGGGGGTSVAVCSVPLCP